MSTNIYLECMEHDPPIQAGGESGQHLYDLDNVRRMVAKREVVCAFLALSNYIGIQFDDHFNSNTAWFLMQHQKCRLQVRTEYDDIVWIEGEPDCLCGHGVSLHVKDRNGEKEPLGCAMCKCIGFTP